MRRSFSNPRCIPLTWENHCNTTAAAAAAAAWID